MKFKKFLIILVTVLVFYTLIGVLLSIYSISTTEYINPCGNADLRPGEIAGVCPEYIGDKSFSEKFELIFNNEAPIGYIFLWPLWILPVIQS